MIIGGPIVQRVRARRWQPTARPIDGVCDFAVDPQLEASSADLHWLPAVDPRIVRLTADTTGAATLALRTDAVRIERIADEGRYLLVGPKADVSAALVLPITTPEQPLMALVPLDLDAPQRVDALLRLWRRIVGRPPQAISDRLSAARRKRLVMSLRAVDARRAGADRREIAKVLFGADAVPEGVKFDDHHLRSRTSRLIRDGLAMIAGGYRKLLKD